MVKGVNRQVIEICNTDHPYFERALLIVRGDLSEEEAARLHTEAKRWMREASLCRMLHRSRRQMYLRQWLFALLGAAASAALFLWLT